VRAADGTVVGMIAATAPEAPAAVVPIDTVREVAEEIIAEGRASHPWIGLTVRDLEPDEREAGRVGARVTEVSDDGPARVGGIAVGDVIVMIDTVPVDSSTAFVAALRTHEPGDTVEVVVRRGDDAVPCTVVLDSHVVAVA
jgi:putative serine protease PepD